LKSRAHIATSIRVAALYVLLALGSSIVLVTFIHLQTRDDALAQLHSSVDEEAQALIDINASGGPKALLATMNGMLAGDDPALLLALLAPSGQRIAGNIDAASIGIDIGDGFHIAHVQMRGRDKPMESGLRADSLPGGLILVSGRVFDSRLSLQQALQRTLFLTLVLSIILGLAGGVILSRYVGRRLGAISRVVDEAGNGNFSTRAPVSHAGDAFDALAARINDMLSRIQALMDELRMLTDSLAHDLRSPVSRLRARIERALTVNDEGQREAALNGVLNEADTLMRMLTTVLEIGRSEAMTSRDQFETLNPTALIDELGEIYGPLVEEAGLALTLDVEGPLPSISGHRQLLAQALSNLIDNALNYGSAGGVITLLAKMDGNMIVLGLADKGPGIAPEHRAEARRRFGRLDKARSRAGAGLGLALVDAVARLHGGQLELGDNQPGLRAVLRLAAPPMGDLR